MVQLLFSEMLDGTILNKNEATPDGNLTPYHAATEGLKSGREDLGKERVGDVGRSAAPSRQDFKRPASSLRNVSIGRPAGSQLGS